MELVGGVAPYLAVSMELVMLVERGLQVMNVEVVGDAYAIASNYLRKTGADASRARLAALPVDLSASGCRSFERPA